MMTSVYLTRSPIETLLTDRESIERLGFVFVVDATDVSTVKDVKVVLEQLNQIEKTSNLYYHKCVLINKSEQIIEERKKQKFETEMERLLKNNYKVVKFKVSALTNFGVKESIKKFVAKLHQEISEARQNDGIQDFDEQAGKDDEVDFGDKVNACFRQNFGGGFFCGA